MKLPFTELTHFNASKTNEGVLPEFCLAHGTAIGPSELPKQVQKPLKAADGGSQSTKPFWGTRTRTTKCRMGGSAQRRLPGAWAGTGAPRRIFGWGTLPLRCLIGVGVAACSVCLSVCLSAFALAWWLVCGWLAILPLACDLRTTSVPSDFLPWASPWRFLPWLSPWRCESGPRWLWLGSPLRASPWRWWPRSR